MFTRRPTIEAGMPMPSAHQTGMPPLLQSPPPTPAGKTLAADAKPSEDGVVIIGRGTRVIGKIGDCRMLDVHGVLEADVVADFLVVREGGGIKGVVQSVSARVHGIIEGTLVVSDHLEIQSTGQVTGDVSYRTLAIQAGARLRGNIVCSEPEPTEAEFVDPTSNVIPISGVAHEVSADEPRS